MRDKKNSKDKPKERKTALQLKFGEVVRKRRISCGFSQEALAEKADLHFTYISSVERGERNISLANIYKIAQALGCSMSDLMTQ